MPLPPGTLLGQYEILTLIGAGGMGEVYKARDPKLDRLVAIKVLPADLAGNPDLMGRFQLEARAVAALNHPSLVGIYDLGQAAGQVFAVMELLEGETLFTCLARGPLSPRRAVECAIQIAQGMAVAHDKGIIHRDLKPDNLWITREGRIKILDFGLAKRTAPSSPRRGELPAPTEALGPGTQQGMVLGTVGYMSPEQVRGDPADHRSDIFSFGVVLYEMLSGRRAFRADTPVQTMSAILEADPEPLRTPKGELPPALEQIVLHCLEKLPQNRFQSMRDLAFGLDHLGSWSGGSAAFPAPPPRRSWKRAGTWAAGAALVVLGAALAAWRLQAGAGHPVFTPLTFATAPVWAARFTRDGASAVFTRGARYAPDTSIQALAFDNPLARPVLARNGALAALGPNNELATLTGLEYVQGRPETFVGTLGRCPLAGATPRAIASRVVAADWTPDGSGLALVRDEGPAGMRIEYPEGRVLARVDRGWFSHLRFSPDGSRLAVIRHPEYMDDMGSILLIEPASGQVRELCGPWASALGLAWPRSGREIWFTAATLPTRELRAVDLHGKVRTITTTPTDLALEDLAPDGRALMTSGEFRIRPYAFAAVSGETTDLAIRSLSLLKSASQDAQQIVIDDEDAEGPEYPMYLCTTDGRMPTPLGRGLCAFPVPGGQKVFVLRGQLQAPKGVLLSLDSGQEEPIQMGTLSLARKACVQVSQAGALLILSCDGKVPSRLWQVSAQAPPAPVGAPLPPDVLGFALYGPVGPRAVMARAGGGVGWVDLAAPGSFQPVPGLGKDTVVGTSLDGNWAYVVARFTRPLMIDRIQLATGRREPFRKLDLPGGETRMASSGYLNPDGTRWLSNTNEFKYQLFLVEGLK